MGVFIGTCIMFIPFVARDRLGASETLMGLIAAAPFIGNFVSLFYTKLSEGKLKLPYVMWPQAIGRGSLVLAFFVDEPIAFALLVVFMHVGNNVGFPAYSAVIKEVYPQNVRGRLMAYVRVGAAFFSAICALIVGKLLQVMDYNMIFVVAAVIGAASAVIFGTVKTSTDYAKNETGSGESMLQYLRATFSIFSEDKGFLWFMVSMSIFGFANIMAFAIYPIYQVDVLKISSLQVGILANVVTVAWMLSYPWWGRFVDRRSPIKAMLVAVAITAVIPATYLFADSPMMLIPAAIANGLMMSGLELCYFNGIFFFAPEGKEQRYQSLHAALAGIRGMTAPFLGTWLVTYCKQTETDMRAIFVLVLLMMSAGAVMHVVKLRKYYTTEN